MKRKSFLMVLVIIFMCLSFFSSSVIAAVMTYDVTNKAELKKISMHMKKIRKKSDQMAVVFELTIKNVDSKANLYSVTVFIPGAGGAQSFVPYKGDKKIAPQTEGTASIGIIYPKFPEDGYSIKIEAVESR